MNTPSLPRHAPLVETKENQAEGSVGVVSFTPEKGFGKLEKGGSTPGAALASV